MKCLRFPVSLVFLLALLGTASRGQAEEPAAAPVAERPAIERDLVYAEVNGRKLHLDLYRPKEAGPHPVVLWVHGGGWAFGNKRSARVRFLTASGYAVASVEYRLTGEATHPAQIHDVKAAVRWLRGNAKRLGLSTEWMAAAGGSAGGHLVSLLGTSGGVKALEGSLGKHLEQSSRIQAVVNYFGISDILRMGEGVRNPERAMSASGALGRLLGGAVADKQDVARMASPIHHVTKDDPPFLHLHGDRDLLVPLKQSELLDAALRKVGVSSRLEVLRGSGHSGAIFFSGERQTLVVDFLAKARAGKAASKTADPTTPSSTPPARELTKLLGQSGPHAFGRTDDITLEDEARNKSIPLRITWPKTDGSHPVLIWSHGLGGSARNYEPLAQHMASHGWVVIQPTHTDSRALGRNRVEGFSDWENRPKDIHRLIDALPTLQQQAVAAGYTGTMDRKRIGMAGHSYGAFTSQLIAGATTRSRSGEAADRGLHGDARAKAFVLVSPQGRDNLLDEASWKTIRRPTMTITGTRDGGRGNRPYTWRLEPYQYMPAGEKILAVLDGATHAFGGIGSRQRAERRGGVNESHIAAVNALLRTFLEAHVLGDERAKALLVGEGFAQNQTPKLRYERK